MSLNKKKGAFGTAPVFFTAISTILGAIMFLRFGYAVGNLGFYGTLGVIVLGHLVTIPTAMAIAEIATNQKVEGGGEYFIISRSFGINIGAAIGVALYLSQAISVAFYVIAFAEAFDPLVLWAKAEFGLPFFDKRMISFPATLLLSWLMIKKGADLGTKALYAVVAILILALAFFFAGMTEYRLGLETIELNKHVNNPDDFFYVFAIVFPAFTGMTAGVGLSGDLKDPKKSIPVGTLAATLTGMVLYVLIAYKLMVSASPEDLVGEGLVMSQISRWPLIIPIGLAAATISSALGSIMVAPRTLQALASDKIFPFQKMNSFLAKGKPVTKEPTNATLVTSGLALVFVMAGDVNVVAKIISMFFMITYGSICLISFLNHFAADPSYRPSFKSKWIISALGAVLCLYMMFSMDAQYALISVVLMTVLYLIINQTQKSNEGLAKIFQGAMFQLSRQIQIFIQNAKRNEESWRPSVICISSDFFERPNAFNFMRWLSHRYGFGTYLHYINGYFSNEASIGAKEQLAKMIEVAVENKSNVYLDTLISPSYTSAIAQAMQLPSVSGKELNMLLFEFSKSEPESVNPITENLALAKSAELDVCVLATGQKGFGFKRRVHIWITAQDFINGNLMIMLGYVLMGHPDWKKAEIELMTLFPQKDLEEQKNKLLDLIKTGRLPISPNNVTVVEQLEDVGVKEVIKSKSKEADLTIVGFHLEAIKQLGSEVFLGYEDIGNLLFVSASSRKTIQ